MLVGLQCLTKSVSPFDAHTDFSPALSRVMYSAKAHPASRIAGSSVIINTKYISLFITPYQSITRLVTLRYAFHVEVRPALYIDIKQEMLVQFSYNAKAHAVQNGEILQYCTIRALLALSLAAIPPLCGL